MVWIVVGVGVVTAAVLLGLVVALFRHLRALSESLVRLQEDLLPVLEDIRRSSEEAQGRMIGLEERQASLGSDSVRG
ncbi:MAG: hypothetical protein ACRDKA_03710 [Actinomycetota bacterium]